MAKVKKILLVEDDDDARWGLALFLKKEGYTVFEGRDGVEAVDILNKNKVDLILCDLKMPRLDGLALLKHCKKNSINTPFVIMTAYGDCESYYDILNWGAFEYLNKPVNLEDVRLLIKKIEEGTNERD